MNLEMSLKPLRATANPSPIQRPGSLRRTASLDYDWVDGPQGERRVQGVARDFLTPSNGGAGRTTAAAQLDARIDPQRTITAIAATPASRVWPNSLIREAVLSELRGPAGCTHLNDALRALAEVPKLVEQLAA